MSLSLRVGTRGSALALMQTDLAIRALVIAASSQGIELATEIVTISTSGDESADKAFKDIGAKGVFARELQRALADGRIDIAVHSLKDLESSEPEGLVLSPLAGRADPRDVLISRDGSSLAELPANAVVGTSSSRRLAQLRVARPDLATAPLRGNVDTRLEKIKRGDVDAGILAGAGVARLQREDEITEWLDPLQFVPAPGQGTIALETLATRSAMDLSWIDGVSDGATRACVDCERTFMIRIEGGCEVPLGAWARFEDGVIVCEGFLSSGDGSEHIRATARGTDPLAVGEALADLFYDAGASELMRAARLT